MAYACLAPHITTHPTDNDRWVLPRIAPGLVGSVVLRARAFCCCVVRLLDYSCVLFRCLKAPDQKPTRSRTPGCTWRGRYCAGPPETDDGEICMHDAQHDWTGTAKSKLCARMTHARQMKRNTHDDNTGASPIDHRPGGVSEAPRALCWCNSIGAADAAMERKT